MIEANPFGPLITPENVIFRLWAPGAKRVELLHQQTHEMRRSDDGWFKLTIPGAWPGDRYRFRIDGETEVPEIVKAAYAAAGSPKELTTPPAKSKPEAGLEWMLR